MQQVTSSFKKICLTFVSFGLCLTLNSCTQEPPAPVEITLIHGWGTMEEDHVQMRQIYENFEKENPDIHLKLQSLPSSEAVIQKTRDMLSVGKVPDIIFTGGLGPDSIYDHMLSQNLALDLMPYIASDPQFKADIAPQTLNSWETDGRLYTVADTMHAGGGYWYNEDIFHSAGIESPPETWESFLDACDKIQAWSDQNGSDVIPIQLRKGSSSLHLFSAILADCGTSGAEWVLNHNMDLSQQDVDSALQIMRKIQQFTSKADSELGYRDARDVFNSGKSAMYINGAWASHLIDANLPVKYACFPGIDGKTSATMTVSLGYIVGNTGNQETMDASVRFLKYLLSEQTQTALFEITGQIPTNPKINLHKYRDKYPRQCQAFDAINSAERHFESPYNYWSSGQISRFNNSIFEVLDGNISTNEFIAYMR